MSGKVTVQWVSRIRAAWHSAVTATIEVGKLLLEAKEGPDKLPHGEFGRMIETEMPFDRVTAWRLMKIASDKRIVANLKQLPNRVSTLFAISHLSDEEFEDRLSDGTIHPKMKHDDLVPEPTVPSALFPPAPGRPADRPPRLPSPEDALAQSELTGEAVQARDGRFYSHVEMQKRFTADLVDGLCDFAESIVVNLSDPRLVELCDDPAVRERVRRHCERLAEECWKFANGLEAKAA